MSEEPKLDAAKRPNGLRAMADGMIYLAGQTGVETANVWQTADILRAAASEMERLKQERDETLLQLKVADQSLHAALYREGELKKELSNLREAYNDLIGSDRPPLVKTL